jgi:glutamine synthetase
MDSPRLRCQGHYYCSAGADVAFGREIAETHLRMCVKAGLTMSGINSEVMAGQWEFQVGPCRGIDAGDQLTMARYIMARVSEKFGVVISYQPKPVGGVNGSGGHVNFSTRKMREDKNALTKHIIPAIERLKLRHAEHIYNYGRHNEKRLTGRYETASMATFTWGIANRQASVRIGNETATNKRGYFEDRRPAANLDPYLVTGMIFDTCVLDGQLASIWPSPPPSATPSARSYDDAWVAEKKAKSPRGRNKKMAGGCAVIM